MGLFSGAKAQFSGQKAIRTHIAANQAANEGKLAEAKEKYAQAYKLYEEAMREGPQKPNICQGHAILLMRLGEFDRAMGVMEKLRHGRLTDDDWFDLRLNYAICLWKKGRLDDAIATGKRAFQAKKCASIYSTLGMFLVEKADQTGDFAETIAFCDESMEYDDEDAGILDNMGELYEAMSKRGSDPEEAAELRRKAKAYYAKAHAQKPRQITTIYSLSRMYHEDGEDAEARAVLADAKNLYYSAVCSVSEDAMEALKQEIG